MSPGIREHGSENRTTALLIGLLHVGLFVALLPVFVKRRLTGG